VLPARVKGAMKSWRISAPRASCWTLRQWPRRSLRRCPEQRCHDPPSTRLTSLYDKLRPSVLARSADDRRVGPARDARRRFYKTADIVRPGLHRRGRPRWVCRGGLVCWTAAASAARHALPSRWIPAPRDGDSGVKDSKGRKPALRAGTTVSLRLVHACMSAAGVVAPTGIVGRLIERRGGCRRGAGRRAGWMTSRPRR
jgi:hypothetical protein